MGGISAVTRDFYSFTALWKSEEAEPNDFYSFTALWKTEEAEP